ncbi:MAG: MATE family efflux transporter, partial [Lachnospiraceae bacterium]|nr:MATE family efflux transporter [Lachnospiraceae bacterium]
VPYAFTQCFYSTLRECGRAVPPMVTGLIAMSVKVILNILLIFGNLGFPRLGVAGAAIAVVISRFVELAVIALWTKFHLRELPFMQGVFRSLKVPGALQLEMIRRAAPLMVNEALWTGGVAFMAQAYTTRELTAVAAVSISSTFYNLLSVTFIAAGIAIGILIGRLLGTRDFERAKEEARKMIVFTALIGAAVAVVFVGVAFLAPELYNVTPEVRRTARDMLLITALFLPVNSALICAYYVVRSGGKTVLTTFLDSGLMWLFQCVPAYLLSRFTGIRVIPLYFWVQFGMVLKLAVNLYFVRRGDWVHSLVEEEPGG